MTAGAELRRAREAAGMSLTQVSDATRVRRTVIEAIEADDLGPSGGATYARGHIKAICAVLGLDPATVLAHLDVPTVAQTSPHADDVPAAPTATRSLGGALGGTQAAAAERRGPNWSAVMAGALVLVLALGGYQLIRSEQAPAPTAQPGTGSSASPAPDTSSPPPSSSPTPDSSEPDDDAIARAEGVSVVLTMTGQRSWVSVVTAKGTVFEGILSKGERRTFKDRKKISFVFGDAGSVGLRVNGVEIGAPGGAGQVVRTTFGPDDPDSSRA